jgi:hypothetical protein
MKTYLLLTVLFCASQSLVWAGLKLPSKIFEAKEMEQAMSEAQAKGKPLSILYTDKDSTCPLCNDAAGVMIKELGNKTVMVYARSTRDLPQPVRDALRPGNYIPKIAVFDASLQESLGMVTYEAVKEDARKAFRDVERAIRDYKKSE